MRPCCPKQDGLILPNRPLAFEAGRDALRVEGVSYLNGHAIEVLCGEEVEGILQVSFMFVFLIMFVRSFKFITLLFPV